MLRVSCWPSIGGILLGVAGAFAQATSGPTDSPSPVAASSPATSDSPDLAAARQAYQDVYNRWKEKLTQLRVLGQQFEVAEESQLVALQEQFQATLDESHALVPQLRQAALRTYVALPDPGSERELTQLLIGMVRDDIDRDEFPTALELGRAMLEKGCDDKRLYSLTGFAAFAMHEFADAKKFWQQAVEFGVLDPKYADSYHNASEYEKLWAEEQALREQEEKADDLPRVKLETNRGEIVLELFENEAPETVGNFVSLVEKGFYDGLSFHRVLKNFMAQGGDPNGDGSGGPGYNIYCECFKPNHRKHFRGSLSMAKMRQRDTGGSQFFLTFLPTPELNGQHTVFGRVIEGMEVLSKIQRRDPESKDEIPTADQIVKATVVRKRDHKYVPTKVR